MSSKRWAGWMATVGECLFAASSLVAEEPKLRAKLSHPGRPFSVAFSEDGKLVAAGDLKGQIRIWDVASGKEVASLKREKEVRYLTFSKNGKWLASGGASTMTLWDVRNKKQKASYVRLIPSTNRFIQAYASVVGLAFHPESTFLAVVHGDRRITLWDVTTEKEKAVWEGGKGIGWVCPVAFSPDTVHLAAAWWYTTPANRTEATPPKLWDVKTEKEVRTLKVTNPEVKAQFRHLAFSGDGKLLVAGEDTGTVRVWEMPSGKEKAAWVVCDPKVTVPVQSLALSADGKVLVTSCHGYGPASIKVWDVETGRERFTISNQFTLSSQVALTPDGKILAITPLTPNATAAISAIGENKPSVVSLWDIPGAAKTRKE